jgi:2-succinyl-5-enolpyruvyl-6-hydroxy-3-cyclohexene-1-carboxylate synthase
MVESKVALPQGWPAEEPNIAQIQAASQTIILAGAGSGKAAAELAELAGWPLLAEPSSGARFGNNAIVNYRLLLQQKTQLVNDVKRVIVFGKPTLNRQAISILFRTDVEITVVRNIDYGFFDVSKRALRFVDSVEPLGEPMVGWLDAWKDASREVAVSKQTEGINRHIVIQAVWGATDSKDSLLLGASRLIRDAENWAPRKEVRVYSNRGLAGIDGTIATAAGISIGQNPDATTRVLLGDLAFLHDVGSLVADETEPNLQVIVVNDHGGTIFASLDVRNNVDDADFQRFFAAGQNFKIDKLAKAFGWKHLLAKNEKELNDALELRGRVIIEIQLD